MTSDKYIEVVGEAQVEAKILYFNAELRIFLLAEVGAAEALRRLEALRARALEALRPLAKEGIAVVDAGAELNRSDRRKKEPVGYGLLNLRLRTMHQMAFVLEQVEAAIRSDETSITATFKQPQFQEIDRPSALTGAFANARTKAAALATAAGGNLGTAISVAELPVHKQDSNVLGDRDIWGDDARFHIGGAGADDVAIDAVRCADRGIVNTEIAAS